MFENIASNKTGAVIKKERNYGIDLLRIVSMLMVCVLHVLGHGGVLRNSEPQSVGYYVAYFLEISAFCAVNCYALVSGFVGAGSRYKISNLIYLWLQVVFYSFGITVVYSIAKNDFNIKTIIKSCLPVTFGAYWYFTAYFALFMFMPILNIAIEKLPRNIFKFSLIFILIASTLLSRVSEDIFKLSSGYSTLWLIVMYLTGGYIKKYNPFKDIKTQKVIIVWLLMIFATWGYKFAVEKGSSLFLDNARSGDRFMSYLSPTIVIVSVSLLELFSRIKFIKKPFVTSFLSTLSFGVYLAHENNIVRANFITGKFTYLTQYNYVILFFAVLGMAAAIYLVCSAVDYVRLLIFKLLRVKPNLEKIENKLKNKYFKDISNV